MSSTILITGAAGFIGMHVSRELAAAGNSVVGVDNLNDYYDPALKNARLAQLESQPGFAFERADIADHDAIEQIFERHRPEYVVHLAAQAGVRYALEHPYAYVSSNLQGSTVILEACRRHRVRHLVFASSSSVYGGNSRVPFSETDAVDHPVSFYAATKRANELMAHSYAHLFAVPVTMLRYFTVYGPWGRPDMAIWKFTDGLLSGTPIDVYASGLLSRDFTYIDDVAQATARVLRHAPKATGDSPGSAAADRPDASWAPFQVFNVGRSDPVSVNRLVELLERNTGAKAIRRELPMQPGDVERTCADVSKLRAAIGFEPSVSLDKGLARFVEWFRGWRARREDGRV